MVRTLLSRSMTAHEGLFRRIGLSFGLIVVGNAAALVMRVLLARMLGVEAYGSFAYALAWANGVLLVLTVYGLHIASSRFVPSYRARGEWQLLRGFLRFSRRLSVGLSAGLGAVVLGAALLLRDRITQDLFGALLLVALLLPFNALLQITGRTLLALKQVFWGQAPMALLRPLVIIGVVLIAFPVLGQQRTATSAMAYYLGATALLYLVSAGVMRRSLPPEVVAAEPSSDRRTWLGVSGHLTMNALFTTLCNRVDILLLGIILGTTEAGIYEAAVSLVLLVNLGLHAVNSIVAPTIADLYARGEIAKLQRIVTLSAYGIFAYMVPSILVLVFFGERILGLFGPEFTKVHLALVVLAMGAMVNSMVGSVGFILTMTGHEKDVSYVLAFSTAASLVLNLVLIHTWGIMGAAVASSATTILWNLLLYWRAKVRTGIDASVLYEPLRRMNA
jgi:O-antigen/teichoic acid export membrane protein